MPRKRATVVPGAAAPAAPAADPIPAAEKVIAEVNEAEAHPIDDLAKAQAAANARGRAVATPQGWVCPHPDSQPKGKA